MFFLKEKKIDIVVGIPSYNEADNIAFVVQQIDNGLQKYFPGFKSLIINVDNDSPDDTKKAFLKAKTKTEKKYITTPKGVKGKGNNFNNLFREVRQLEPRACLVLDADLKSVKPEWIKKMLNPVLKKKYDYILPVYSRNEYDGTITNNICYPLLYGVLGYNIRQPIAGDFAFSLALNNFWIERRWYESTYQYGIDIFMTLNAVFGNFKIGQVAIGSKVHKPSAPKLGPMFTQVLNTLFGGFLDNKDFWLRKRKLYTPTIFYNGKNVDPQPLSIDYKSMKKTALEGFTGYKDFYKKIFPASLYNRLIKSFQDKTMNIDMSSWIDILFFSLKAMEQSEYRHKVIESLKPLYFARVSSFIKKTLDLNYKESEAEIVKQAELCYKKRDELIKMFS